MLILEVLGGAELSSSFESLVILIFTPVTNMLLCRLIISKLGNLTHYIKGLSRLVNHNRCYRLLPLMTAPVEW